MILCSPTGKAIAQGFVPPKRPETPAGLRVGLLDNTKAPVDHMLRHIGERLRLHVPGCTTFTIAKQHPLAAMEPEVLLALRENADVVINALGD